MACATGGPRESARVAASRHGASAAVIFITAYDEHALAAFDARALDYVLKPVAPDRFDAAMARARKVLERSQPQAHRPPLARYARRFLVEEQSRSVFVAVEAIAWFESARNHVILHTGRGTYIMRATLDRLFAGSMRGATCPPIV